jgi:hypothetical protein
LVSPAEIVFFHPVNFQKTPLEAVAKMGLSQGPAQRNAEFFQRDVFLKLYVKRELAVFVFATLLEYGLELPRSFQPLGLQQSRHCFRFRLFEFLKGLCAVLFARLWKKFKSFLEFDPMDKTFISGGIECHPCLGSMRLLLNAEFITSLLTAKT